MVIRIALLVCALSFPASAQTLSAVTWNVESGGAEPAVIATQLADLPTVQLYALQEVHPADIDRYGQAIRHAHGDDYRYFASWTGRSDRLVVAFDTRRLTLLEWRELFRFGDNELNDWRHRSPLVCLFEDRETGQRFYLVTVHLARGDSSLRTEQAAGLREWARSVSDPVIAIGDFNFDFYFPTQQGNEAFTAFVEGDVWRWAKPEILVDTNWSDRDGDGVDNYPDSCLDFVFYAGVPANRQVTSKVIVRAGDFPDDDTTSDHRPVMAEVSLP